MADAGFKLSVEGEKEFRKAISDVNAILKLNQAELQRVTAEYNASDKSMEAMTDRQKELGEVMGRQTTAVEQMEGELSRLTETYGENDKGVIKMRTEVEKARTTLAAMTAQFQANAEEMGAASKVAETYGMSVEDIEAQIRAADAEIKAMDAAMSGNTETMGIFGRRAEDTEKQVADLEKKSKLLTEELQQQQKKHDLLNEEMQEAIRLYGNQSREVAEYRVKIAQTSTDMSELTRRIEENNREIENAKDPATDLKDVFAKISDITGAQIPEGLTAVVGGVGAAEAAVMGGLVPALGAAVKKVVEMQLEMRSAASEITKLSEETGLDTETIQVLQELGDYYGVGADTLKDSLKDLRNNMYDAAGGNAELAQKFAELDVSIMDSEGNLRNLMDVYLDMSQAFFMMEDQTARLAKAEELLGESVNQSAQIATAGKAELMRVINLIYEKGLVQTKETIAQLEAQEKAWKELGMTVEGTWKKINLAINNMGDDKTWEKAAGFLSGWGNIVRFVQGYREAATTDIVKSYGGGSGTTVNNYNITVSASDVKEFNDIVNMVQNQRVTGRMK